MENPLLPTTFVIEEIQDPSASEHNRRQHERAERNREWLQTHGEELLPRARGKFLAIAGQEAYVADTPEETWAWIRSAHSDDNGAFVQWVRSEQEPRIYANRRVLAAV